MTDRALLEQLFAFLKERDFVLGNETSVKDMVLRYARPPLTMHYRAAMQLTIQDYKTLGKLLKTLDDHLKEVEREPSELV
jgi:hypothetical protein